MLPSLSSYRNEYIDLKCRIEQVINERESASSLFTKCTYVLLKNYSRFKVCVWLMEWIGNCYILNENEDWCTSVDLTHTLHVSDPRGMT